jgi:hypothetical protein
MDGKTGNKHTDFLGHDGQLFGGGCGIQFTVNPKDVMLWSCERRRVQWKAASV